MGASKKREYFGTDGVRGRVGTAPMTADFVLRLANAAARVLVPNGGKVLIGKDTRLSGYMFESALEAGFVAAGIDVLLIGPLPTPGVAYMTKQLSCDFGIVISASHNQYNDNGIKFFDRNGEKLSDGAELEIEALLKEPPVTRDSKSLGRATRVDELRAEYEKFCAGTFPSGMTLQGMKLAVDCANGAAYKVAPRVLSSLGAEVLPVGTSPNGKNINDGCGATAPGLLQMMVPGAQADAGIALDGDADRLIMVDHEGNVVDGDQLVFILARARKEKGNLKGPVVGTVLTNMGIEHAFLGEHIGFKRASVGDRYVREMLIENKGTVGGESSGHILLLDKTPTGDALIAALEVLSVMKETGKTLKELASGIERFPQVQLNVAVKGKIDPADIKPLQEKIIAFQKELGDEGRILVRASGTEPVIRVMVETKKQDRASGMAEELAETLRTAG